MQTEPAEPADRAKRRPPENPPIDPLLDSKLEAHETWKQTLQEMMSDKVKTSTIARHIRSLALIDPVLAAAAARSLAQQFNSLGKLISDLFGQAPELFRGSLMGELAITMPAAGGWMLNGTRRAAGRAGDRFIPDWHHWAEVTGWLDGMPYAIVGMNARQKLPDMNKPVAQLVAATLTCVGQLRGKIRREEPRFIGHEFASEKEAAEFLAGDDFTRESQVSHMCDDSIRDWLQQAFVRLQFHPGLLQPRFIDDSHLPFGWNVRAIYATAYLPEPPRSDRCAHFNTWKAVCQALCKALYGDERDRPWTHPALPQFDAKGKAQEPSGKFWHAFNRAFTSFITKTAPPRPRKARKPDHT